MEFTVIQKTFSGPLELLLELIENSKKEITDVSLKEVTNEFLKYVESIGDDRAEELADFLVVAARLFLLKSRTLVPGSIVDDVEGISLEEQLRMYHDFVEASKNFAKIWSNRRMSFAREGALESALEFAQGFYAPSGLTVQIMQRVFESILQSIIEPAEIPKKTLIKIISIREKIVQIKKFIEQNGGKTTLRGVFASAKDKIDIILGFIALLELVKQRSISLSQSKIFGDIDIWSSSQK